MGFFRRFFQFKERDASGPDSAWAVEENGTELVLSPEDAAHLLAEIDIDAALSSHTQWRLQLEDVVYGRSDKPLHADRVSQDQHCELGRWLHGQGRERLGHYPAFSMLVARHKYFHQQAGLVVDLHRAGDRQQAQQLLASRCRHASNQVIFLLNELKRGLGR